MTMVGANENFEATDGIDASRCVPALNTTPMEFRMLGGRLVATSHGPAAMFMYDDDHGSRIVVLTRAMSSADQNAPMTPQSQGDVGGFAWADDGLGYSLMGRAAPESLRLIANEVRRQARSI
jgi:anti-sigma factor RsiW